MTRNATSNLGRWHERRGNASRKPSSGRVTAGKWAQVVALSSLMMGVVVVAAWIVVQFLFLDPPRPYFSAFWVGESQQRAAAERADPKRDRLASPIPPIPWLNADRQALKEARIFTRVEPGENRTWNPTRDVISLRLQDLRALKPESDLVVYLAADAMVDAQGQIRVLAYDSDPYRPETLVPLKFILASLKECPARRKLLILDVMRRAFDPAELGGTADGVGDLIRGELHEAADPHLLVLGACSPGETGLGSETLGRSIFGHFFRLGLIDPQADVDKNRAISVKELARYLERKVNQWAKHYRNTSQRPFLIGSGPDFPLASITKKTAPGRKWTWKWPWKSATPAPEPFAVVEMEENAKDKPAAAKKAKGPPPLPGGFPYPEWLADGWNARETWWRNGDYLKAPRVFQRLDAVLLRAEWRWRGGDDPAVVRDELAGERSRLDAAMNAARKWPRPSFPRSVAQARILGLPADPDLAIALKTLLRIPIGQIDAIRKKEFLGKVQGKTSLALAEAIVDTLAELPFDPRTLDLLDALVTESQLPRDLIELRKLSMLARRARAPGGGWSDEIAKGAWEVTLAAESANSRHDALPWVRNLLDRADALRHNAEVMSLPQTAGFAPESQTVATWNQARALLNVIQTFQDRLDSAQIVRGKALVLLRGSIPYIELVNDPSYESAWSTGADQVRTLDRLLTRPDQPLSDEPLADLNRALNDALRDLSRTVTILEQPFEPGEMSALVERCTSKSTRAEPTPTRMIEAILSCPFPTSRGRQELWAAGKVLDSRLAALPMAEPDPERDAVDSLEARVSLPGERLTRRIERIAAIAALADHPIDDKSFRATADAKTVWGSVAEAFQAVHNMFEHLEVRADQADMLDRPGWVAPVFSLDWQRNPTWNERVLNERAGWSWLAGHYLHRASDLNDTDLAGTTRFYQDASLDCANSDPADSGSGGLPRENVLEATLIPTTNLRLSREHPDDRAEVQFLLRTSKGNGSQRVTFAVLKPDDPRLEVHTPSPDALDLEPGRAEKIAVQAHWNDQAGRPAPVNPSGFLVQASLANLRTYHVLVRTDIVSDNNRPRLVLSRHPTGPDEVSSDHIHLRPIPGRQAFYLFVRNPAPVARDLLVELSDGASAPIVAKMKVEPNSTPIVPGFGLPPLKPEDPLPPLNGPIRITLRENRPEGAVLEEKRVVLDIATADDYLNDDLEITRAQFIPSTRAGGKNRLSVALKALDGLSAPPCKIELDFPKERSLFPALREPPKGTLSGRLEPKGNLLLLVEDLALDPSAPTDGTFFLNIDGIERALWFRTSFARDGVEQRADQDRRARLRLRHVYDPTAAVATLTVGFIVDNAPKGSKLVARLGRAEGDQFADDIPRWTASAKDETLGFSARGEGNALVFEARIKDREQVFNIPRIRGKRVFKAWLLDQNGRKELAPPQTLNLLLDDQIPEAVSLDVPRQVARGTLMVPVRGSVIPPASGIKDVEFFVGPKTDLEKARGAGLSARGKPDPTRRDWEAMLSLPKDAVGAVPVAVRFTSAAGLSSFLTGEVTVLPPPPPPTPPVDAETEKKAPPLPGAIRGNVLEGTLSQTGLDVQLWKIDPAGKEASKVIETVKTGPKGIFLFKTVEAGRYKLTCKKTATNRQAAKTVTVEPGKTTEETLELLLP